MHFAIRFLTEYRYDVPVTDNLNALRVRPATTSTQRCDEFHTRIEPEARVSRHLDYFGTEVLEFGIPTSHEQLTIDVRARVVTSAPPEPPDGSWDSLLTASYVDAAGEFALPWQDQPALAGLESLDETLEADSPLETLEQLCEMIPDRFEYRPGATYVGSSVRDLLDLGAGVCQDFVHLSLVLLRRRGIAARYVSGYLWSAPEDDGTDSVEVDTHAWLEALLPGSGGRGEPVWVSADPTNRRLAGETHVKIGHGRFYADVPPVKGLYMGGALSDLTAAVTMSRLDPQTSARA
ncbi:MAG TPA: transglutaminase family protein [Solirubrobacteraceae bacterium]|jgi:transglutaminase-like putative cysteine protease|nr:transglutaminase family protein [Solirubrobacteraceae bacterium]